MHNKSTFREIDVVVLRTVAGGLAAPMPNMGAPKYSAAWWDIVRSRGLDR
ncbi:MAG TPA: hypothetical protein VIU61_19460 [Kofleriaceae bacterium]